MTMLPQDHGFGRELETAVELIGTVSSRVQEIYEQQVAATYVKDDGSPVTDADLTADAMIRDALAAAFPHDALLTEETEDNEDRLGNPRCWIADPIDGTAQFVNRTGNFDVLLALVVEGRPELSVCAHPPSRTMTVAIRGHGAWFIDARRSVSRVRLEAPDDPPRLVGSRYYAADQNAKTFEAVANTLGTNAIPVLPVGYQPRAFLPSWRTYDAFIGFWRADGDSPVREWDLAASDLFTTEAGGGFTDLYGAAYAYNTPNPRPRSGVLVSASPALHDRLLGALAPLLPASPPVPPGTPVV